MGIAGDVRQYSLDCASKMEVYIAQAQSADLGVNYGYSLVARTTVDPGLPAKSVRDAVLPADRTQPVYDIMPLDAYLGSSLAERTFTLTLLGLFGALAPALSAVGIYGVISYSVSLRTREVGIRMALGAERRDVLTLILGQGVMFIAGGLAAGFLISLAVTRFLGSLLYGVCPSDLATSAAVAGVLAIAPLLASYLPARRAIRVDPMIAPRFD